MSTIIRPEISKKNKYWISKHRYYELKHWCLQYQEWNDMYLYFGNIISRENNGNTKNISKPVEYMVEQREYYKNQMNLLKECCVLSDPDISNYIFKAVTKGLSYVNLQTKYDIPCGKDMYYDRYRKFFFLLSRKKQVAL